VVEDTQWNGGGAADERDTRDWQDLDSKEE
jgi:hypothetical protein